MSELAQAQEVNQEPVEKKQGLISKIKGVLLARSHDLTIPLFGSRLQVGIARPILETYYVNKLRKVQINILTASSLKIWLKKHYKEVQFVFCGFAVGFVWESKFWLKESPAIQEAMAEYSKEKIKFEQNPAIQTPQKLRQLNNTKAELVARLKALNE